jgi:D-arabinose 1-dehydrogenase-like Zn-dependent alcohol dehydrogenase
MHRKLLSIAREDSVCRRLMTIPLQELGGAALVVATASTGKAVSEVMKGLCPRGRVITLGASSDPLEVSTTDLLFGSRSTDGALMGNPATGDATLKFSALTGIAGHDRDHATGESTRSLRQNDVREGQVSHGAHDEFRNLRLLKWLCCSKTCPPNSYRRRA